MQVKVKKWGNSASVRIPASVMQAAQLYLDATVDVRVEGGRIVIEPVAEEAPDLEELIAGITENNLHSEVDFGESVGKEGL